MILVYIFFAFSKHVYKIWNNGHFDRFIPNIQVLSWGKQYPGTQTFCTNCTYYTDIIMPVGLEYIVAILVLFL